MRVCLVSAGDPTRDAEARALARSLAAAGNQVTAVSVATGGQFPVEVTAVDRRPSSLPGKMMRRLGAWRDITRSRDLIAAAAATGAEVFYPIRSRDITPALAAAEKVGAVVARRPGWDVPGNVDLVTRAPAEPSLSSSPAGRGLDHHLPGSSPDAADLEPGRHHGKQVVLVHRATTTTPGRYLGAALERAGVEVIRTESLDWDRVPVSAAGVVIVESPYPAPAVRGTAKAVPVVFWVHHGEHHLAANLRLVGRYRPGAVLMAHSWHLAHRFPVPVHRFPFGIPTELFPAEVIPPAERRWDVAMVGAGSHRGGGRYDRRARLVAELEEEFGSRGTFPRQRVTPKEMASIYRQARMVVNEGGGRHHPITMRVFETVGAGALLVTDDLPGTEVLFRPERHYRLLSEPFGRRLKALLADPTAMDTAQEAHRHGQERHTTDHRVEELLAVLAVTAPGSAPEPTPASTSGIAGLLDADVEVRNMVAHGVDLEGAVPEVVTWELADVVDRLRPGGYDAAAIGQTPENLEELVLSAKRYIYGTKSVLDSVRRVLEESETAHVIEDHGPVFRVDLLCFEGYRSRTEHTEVRS